MFCKTRVDHAVAGQKKGWTLDKQSGWEVTARLRGETKLGRKSGVEDLGRTGRTARWLRQLATWAKQNIAKAAVTFDVQIYYSSNNKQM